MDASPRLGITPAAKKNGRMDENSDGRRQIRIGQLALEPMLWARNIELDQCKAPGRVKVSWQHADQPILTALPTPTSMPAGSTHVFRAHAGNRLRLQAGPLAEEAGKSAHKYNPEYKANSLERNSDFCTRKTK
jgi:hypothetical protein